MLARVCRFAWEEIRNPYNTLVRKSKEITNARHRHYMERLYQNGAHKRKRIYQLRDIGIYERILAKCISEIWGMRVWRGVKYLRIGSNNRVL